MIHEMRLHPQPFDKIQHGIKQIEMRLMDEKRTQLAVGDYMLFLKRPDETETITAKITKLYHGKSFRELAEQLGSKIFGYSTKEELLESMYQYYTPEQE